MQGSEECTDRCDDDVEIVEAHASSKDGFTSMGAVAGLEMETASFNSKTEKVTGNLKHLASQVTPGDITSVYGIRKVMGVAVPARLLEQSLVDLTAGECAARCS
ncbi:UNVERIFIED_CONTAM: hypothetical protein FKN15_055002 [Acipenser sinensis]